MRGLLLSLLFFIPVVGQQIDDQVQRLMAGFISQFPSYVTWPHLIDQLEIGLVGQGYLGRAGQKYLSYRDFSGHRYNLQLLQPGQYSKEDLRQYQILYFGDISDDEIKQLLKLITKEPVLTIGQSPNFLDLGGIIHMKVRGTAVTFDVSTANARKARLLIDPRLIDYGRSM